jgi:hypothetical protein
LPRSGFAAETGGLLVPRREALGVDYLACGLQLGLEALAAVENRLHLGCVRRRRGLSMWMSRM